MNTTPIPSEFNHFFWDTKPHTLDITTHKSFILERLLEEGNHQVIHWVLERFSTDDIKEVICTSRRIRLKTALFWKNRLGITEPIVCMQKHSTQTPAELWK